MTLIRAVAVVLCLVSAVMLSGCSNTMSAMLTSARAMVPFGRPAPESPALDPKFQYLRITRANHTGWMWLGSSEKSPTGTVEVYYSGQGEVLRLQNGRIVGALGLTTEWRQVSVQSPSWSAAASRSDGVAVHRTRDVMPGYRSGVRDELTLRAIAAPGGSALRAVAPGKLTWFEERLQRHAGGGFFTVDADDALPPARYAVDLSSGDGQVVYAEQCLARDLCFAWQRWSAAMQAASKTEASPR